MVVLFDEGSHRHQLPEGSATQLECGVDVPRLDMGKELELLISGEKRMSPTTDSQVNALDLCWDVVSSVSFQTPSPGGLRVSSLTAMVTCPGNVFCLVRLGHGTSLRSLNRMSSTMADADLKTFSTALALTLEVICAANAVPTSAGWMGPLDQGSYRRSPRSMTLLLHRLTLGFMVPTQFVTLSLRRLTL